MCATNLMKIVVNITFDKYSWCSVWNSARAGQDQGGPRWDTLTKKIKVNQIASYCVMLCPRCCSLWPCTFWGLHSSDFDSSEGQTRGSHFNFYWGMDTTIWSNIMYIFHFLCYQNWLLSPTVELASQKAYKTTPKYKKCGIFVFENKFEHVTNNTQFRLAQIRVAPFIHIMLQVCHRCKSSQRCAVTIWYNGI